MRADETVWPCNGAHGQYAYGFFTEDVALYRFRKTRKGEVAAGVFGAREVNQSVIETLALRCADPAGKLAKALDIYAATGKKADVREFLFPKR